jgi:chemotaxis protein methyltransferase CheR
VTPVERVVALLRARFGLEPDQLIARRLTELAERVVSSQRLERWLQALADADLESDDARALVNIATNGQTYFMRDKPQIAALESWLSERYAVLRRPLNVWSAGCSTGEEVYTLALLGLRLGIPLNLTGSDVNADALGRARRGVYSEWALRHMSEADREAHFISHKEGFELRGRVQERVTFRLHNLASSRPLTPDRPDRAWDAILCRNVLIYFAEDVRLRVLNGFEQALTDDGALVLSSSESLRGHTTQLRAQQLVGGGFLFVRDVTATWASPATRASSNPPGSRSSSAPPARPFSSSTPPRRFSTFPPSAGLLPSVKELLDRGNRHLREHSFSDALSHYARAIALDGLSSEPYVLQAIVHLKQGSLTDARASLRSALFLEPRCWASEYLLSGIDAREARHEEHVASLLRAESLLAGGEALVSPVSDITGIEPVCYTREEALSVCRARLKSLRKGLIL